MKVLKFIIENYKALVGRHEVTPEGSSFFLIGANGKGKTSAGKLLVDMLTKNFPSKPITDGELEGYAEITLSDESKFMVKFEEGKKPKLNFVTPDGVKVSTPKDFFEKMAGEGMTFDIDKFLSLAPKPRREMLEKIVGVDLSQLNGKEAMVMEEAKELRREFKGQIARVKPYKKDLAEMEVIDVVELANKINDAKETNYEKKQLEEKIASVKSEIIRLQVVLAGLEKDHKAIEEVPEFELITWEEEFKDADAKNQEIRFAKTMKVEEKKAGDLEFKLKMKEAEVAAVREEKENLIKSKPLPAIGLEFDPESDGLLLNGLPFEDAQIATSAKMIAALQIAESQLGKIRYLHFDASILDKENALKVLEWAESKDLQLCIERALWDGGGLKMEVIDTTGEIVKSEVI